MGGFQFPVTAIKVFVNIQALYIPTFACKCLVVGKIPHKDNASAPPPLGGNIVTKIIIAMKVVVYLSIDK